MRKDSIKKIVKAILDSISAGDIDHNHPGFELAMDFLIIQDAIDEDGNLDKFHSNLDTALRNLIKGGGPDGNFYKTEPEELV